MISPPRDDFGSDALLRQYTANAAVRVGFERVANKRIRSLKSRAQRLQAFQHPGAGIDVERRAELPRQACRRPPFNAQFLSHTRGESAKGHN